MAFVPFWQIVDVEREMELALAQVVLFFSVVQLCELQLETCLAVAQVDERKTVAFLASDLFEVQRLRVEIKAFVQVEHVEIEMSERGFHCPAPRLVFLGPRPATRPSHSFLTVTKAPSPSRALMAVSASSSHL